MKIEKLGKEMKKLRNAINKSNKKIVKLKNQLFTISPSFSDKVRKAKIEEQIKAEETNIKLLEQEHDALVKLASTPPPVPHTVANTESNSFTLGGIIKQ